MRVLIPSLCGLFIAAVLVASASGKELSDPCFAVENGDTNDDFERDVSDGIYLLSHLFRGSAAPAPLALSDGEEPVVQNGDSFGAGIRDVRTRSAPGDQTNPFLSEDHVHEKQPEGEFFLVGAGAADPPTTRHRTLDEDTLVFFAMIDTERSKLEPDPFGCTDEASCVASRTLAAARVSSS